MKTSVSVRLAAVNAVGFSASTVMPLWLGGISQQFDMPPWFASAAIFAQLGGAALFNLLTPLIFRGVAMLPLARAGLLVAAAAYLLAVTGSPQVFIAACLISGAALGVVLNVTNRLMGSAEHVQKGYAIFVLIEVLYASTLFLLSGALIARFGPLSPFPVISAIVVLSCMLLFRLPVKLPLAEAAVGKASSARAAGVICLASFALFFVGQAAFNSFMPKIGVAAGLDAATANRIIGFSMLCALIGAALARVVGERVRPILPIAVVVAVLAGMAPVLTFAPSVPVFVGGMIALGISTIFCVPFFFAQLGALDRAGRYAGFGPAMMLIGIAVGPSIAVLIDDRFGLPAVGAFASALLILGGIGFAFGARAGDHAVSAGGGTQYQKTTKALQPETQEDL